MADLGPTKVYGDLQVTGTITGPVTGNATTATKLVTARSISITGDATWSTSFDGSADVTGALTLANSGVTAGTYPKVTVDAKGRVTTGSVLVAADIPALDAGKITTGTFAAARIPTLNQNTTGSAATLTTARTISITGDATWSTSFNGSANVTGALTLANSGVTAGTYPKVTVDAKGRVTAGAALVAADIPALDASKITTGVLADARLSGTYTGVNITGNAATATKLATSRTINGVAFDGTTNITINAVDATARIAASEKGAANGVATLDVNGVVPASQLPSYVDDVLEFADQASFPAAGESGKIYIAVDTGKIYRWTGSVYVNISANASTADAATKLATARSISITGDATWTTSFDGSTNVTGALTLANSGVTAGTYPKVTVDVKGRVTAGAVLVAADIPALDASKITSGTFAAARIPTLNQNTTGSAATLTTARTISITGDATWTTSFNGSANVTGALTLANSGVTAGTYPKVTVDAKGRVTSGDTLVAADIPALDASKITSGVFPDARLSGTYTGVNITGNAATATKLQTARSIALAGDVTGSATFDGSSNVSITATVADDSHTHDTRYPVLSAERVLAAVPAGSWVTIAQVPSNGGRAYGEFIVYDNDSGKHNAVKIIASHSYGQSVVACVGGNRFGTRTIAHVRILYVTADRTYGGAKLQVYIENTCALCVRALMINQINGWSAWSEMTPVVEGTPAGWAEDTTTRYDDITNTATGFSGSFSGSGALLTGLNAANLASGTIPDARLSGTYTGVNITGNAATATKLATAQTINGTSFDGSANITTANWGTARTLTVGNTGKSVNGSANVSWSLAEIGAAPASHTHNTIVSVDNRALKPSGSVARALNMYFTSKGGLTGTADTVYGDLLVLNGYSDTSGGVQNALFFGKTAQEIIHYQGAIGATQWSSAQTIAYTSSNVASATKLQTARTINGVAFDGSANITISDSTKLPLAGGAMTGTLITKITGHAVGHGGGDGSLSVRGDASSAAVMTFHRVGAYAINLGLDTDNVFRLGGWSDGTNVYRFQVDGSGNFTANGNVTAYSDIRLKKDIRVIPDALAKVEQLSGVTYERIDSGERQTGLIAQEVQKVLPEAVSGDDMLSVAYGNLVGLLVEAIKELKAEVEELKLKVAA